MQTCLDCRDQINFVPHGGKKYIYSIKDIQTQICDIEIKSHFYLMGFDNDTSKLQYDPSTEIENIISGEGFLSEKSMITM